MSEDLTSIPGVGPSLSQDLKNIGINTVPELVGKDPEHLFELSNQYAGCVQDRCVLYVFRCAVYCAEGGADPEKRKWWNWKD